MIDLHGIKKHRVMNIVRAHHLGMCFGVRDALSLAQSEAARQPLTILGELVHNPSVLESLRKSGIRIEPELSSVKTEAVLITAHGVSDRRRAEVQGRGHQILEATCPLVHVAHRALRSLVEAGHHPVVIGKRGHVEVKGLVEDYPGADVVLSEGDIDSLQDRISFGVVAQTTQPVTRVRSLVDYLRRRFPNRPVHCRDTVCLPTKQRQEAAVQLAGECTVVIVVGGRQSNNTRELVETIRGTCARVHHVETADELQAEWLRADDTVGITAGTSTPDSQIEAVELRLRSQFSRPDDYNQGQ